MKNHEAENDKPIPQGQITAKQHFVPRFYLKKFVNSSGFIEVLDISRKTILDPRAPKAVCYEKFFYGTTTGELDDVSQQIEKLFQQWEDSIAKQIEPIIAKLLNNGQIDDKEKWVIAFLMSMLWIRGPAMREQINRMSEEVMKHVNKLRFSQPSTDSLFDKFDRETGSMTTPEMREKLKKTMTEGDYSLKFNNASHMHMFNSFQGFANLFHGQDWVVYISKSAKKFTTSDNPVTVVFPEKQSVYGVSFLERTHYFPLTPETLIMGRYPDEKHGKKLKRKTLYNQDELDILKLNLTTANQAIQYAYATERQSLEDMLLAVNQFEKLRGSMPTGAGSMDL
jgi:Protein of unknown function (DUF4238)